MKIGNGVSQLEIVGLNSDGKSHTIQELEDTARATLSIPPLDRIFQVINIQAGINPLVPIISLYKWRMHLAKLRSWLR